MPKFQGLFVALVTPFDRQNKLDLSKVRDLVFFHGEMGTEGLVLCGTTGEGACLTREEEALLLETAVEAGRGKITILAGAGARSTEETIDRVKAAREGGADGALVVTPFYNRPNQEGLYRHFMALAEACDLPIMLYNVPTRTGVDLLPRTVARLTAAPSILAIKEARADLDRLTELVQLCGDRMDVLSGHDPNLLPALSVGCSGIVSVAGNIVPGEMNALIKAFEKGDIPRARTLHLKLFELSQALAVETNPVPIKAAMNLLGWDVGEVRPPLVPLAPVQGEALRSLLAKFQIQPRPSVHPA